MNENERMEDMTLDSMREDIIARYSEGADGNAEADAEVVTEGGNEGAEGTAAEGEAVAAEEQVATQPAEGQAATQPAAPSFEEAMQFAAMRDENAKLAAEVQTLRHQMAEAQAVAQQNAVAANTAVSEVSSGTGLPTLNMDELMYASEEERQAALNNYNRQLIEIAARQATADMLGKISPLMKQYDTAVAKEQMDSAMNELAALEGFGDVRDHSDRIRQISERPEFANMPMSQRMTLAALVEKGMRASQPVPAQPAPDINAQADAVLANPELMKALTQKQAMAAKAASGNVPTHTAGGGFSNAAFVKSERPATIEEAREKYNAY